MGGWYNIDKIYENPPISTEQIMHPENYTDNEMPLVVSYPIISELDLIEEDTLGEFMIFIMFDNFIDETLARNAAEGWGGDRYYYYEDGEEFLTIFTIEWDTVYDIAEFELAYNTWVTFPEQLEALREGRLDMQVNGNTTTIFYSSNSDLIDEII